jgi:hypothetical protein
MKNVFPSIILFSISLLLSNVAAAQIAAGGNYTLDQSVVAAGGGASAGGTFTVEGTAGQSAAGIKQINQPYNFYSGFWTAQVFATTAASFAASGRVLTASGNGIRNARVALTGADGTTRTVISGKLGYFRFDDVAAGETYIFSVSAKRYTFSQPAQVRSILEDTDDLIFTADFRQMTVESF